MAVECRLGLKEVESPLWGNGLGNSVPEVMAVPLSPSLGSELISKILPYGFQFLIELRLNGSEFTLCNRVLIVSWALFGLLLA